MTGSWVATTQREDDRVTVASARALHDLLEVPGPSPQAGDPLPLLWHWLASWPRARPSELGLDGHPATGTFLPPTGGHRRMFAGASVTGTGFLRVEEPWTWAHAGGVEGYPGLVVHGPLQALLLLDLAVLTSLGAPAMTATAALARDGEAA